MIDALSLIDINSSWQDSNNELCKIKNIVSNYSELSGKPFYFNVSTNNTYSDIVHATDDWFFYVSLITSIIASAVLSFFLIRYYTSKSRKYVNWFLYVPLYLLYTFLFSSVSLITLDTSIALTSPGVVPDSALVICWNIIYYSIQLFSWIILPIFQVYSYTGEFTVYGKVIHSFIENLVFYIILGVVAGVAISVFVIYLAITDVKLINFSYLVNVGIALSNFFGLTLFSVFIGYALVKVPRTVWRKTNIERTVKWNCIEAPGKRGT